MGRYLKRSRWNACIAISSCLEYYGVKMSVFRITKKLLIILNKKQKGIIVLIVAMMLLGGILESVSISLVLPLITAVMDTEGWNAKWYAKIICNLFSITSQRAYIECVLLMLIIVFILKNLYLLYEYYFQNAFIADSRFNMQSKLMTSYTHKPYSYYLTASSGEILRIITQDTNQIFLLLNNMLLIYTELIVSVILGITVFVMSPFIAVWMMLILLVELLVITLVIKPVMKRMGERGRAENAAANKWIIQTINGIKSVKVSKKERFFESAYKKHARKQVEIDRINGTLDALPRLMIEAFTVAGVLFVILILVLSGIELADILPQLSAFVVAAIRLLPSSNRISSSMNMSAFLEGALDNIIRVVTGNEEIKAAQIKNKPDSEDGAYESIPFKQKVELDNVTFSYGENLPNVLDHAVMDIRKGKSIGIVGTSGAGKSTCVDLILGLLAPQDGRVLVDGKDIQTNMEAWLDHLAYIPQQIFLIDDSIRANVAFGVPEDSIKDEDVWEALKEAQLDEFVKGLSGGLDTQIGEQGVRLSGGQRQRLGIARSLFTNAEILFFDEATSALDNETEAAIMESIDGLRGKRTTVIIAHRLTTIMNCDIVYRVENGKISEADKTLLGV